MNAPRSGELHPIVRRRWLVLVVFAIVCAWALPGIGQLRHDDDVLAFLPPEHPDVVTFRRVADRYGMLSVGLIGMRAGGDDLLVEARTEEIRAVASAVSSLPGVRLVLSYPDLPDARVEGETLVVEPLVPKSVTDAEEIRRRVLANPNAVGNLVSDDGRAAALLVYFLDASDVSARSDQLRAIERTVGTQWSGEAYFGGAPFIEDAAASSSRADIERLSPIVIAVLAVASAILLGSITGAGLNLVVTGLGVGLVVGLHGRLGEPFTIVSSTTPVMMVALGGAFGMHVIAGYQRQAGTPAQRASATVRELWLPVVLSGVTTATAFFALVVMPQVPMQRFGVVAGVGVLLLLLLALAVLPAALSLLPSRWLTSKPSRPLPVRWLPPLWLLAALAVGGAAVATGLRADPDTRNVFDADSEPALADRFFNEYFGGSQYVQIAVGADLSEPTVLRRIRSLVEDIRRIDGVSDVRSLIEPVELVTEGFGGRQGIPTTPEQGRRVVTNLADQSPMAQLMTTDSRGAIIHVKLAPESSARLVEITEEIRAVVAASPTGPVRVGDAAVPEVAAAAREQVRRRISDLVGREVGDTALSELLSKGDHTDPALRTEVESLRERALATDELIVEPLPEAEIEAVSVTELLDVRGEALEALLRARLPTLVDKDAEGIPIVAQQLGMWVDEARQRRRVFGMCEALGLPNDPPAAVAPEPQEMFGGEAPAVATGRCGVLAAVVSELSDAQWEIPAGVSAEPLRTLDFSLELTGQPLIGQAFADSVTRSLRTSTLVSWIALALVLLAARQLRSLLPATWTLAVTAGVITLLGHPISIGTSMVSCIALGAGVDFAIHLGIRARRAEGPTPGREAADALGMVVLVTGVQLALAFLVLIASEMPPLRQFGVGLAIGLLTAAAGAVWLTPVLYRRAGPARPGSRSDERGAGRDT